MTTHARFESLAALAIDFELTDDERAELNGHLATCSACRFIASGYRADAAALEAIAAVEPPAWIRSAVLTAAVRPRPRAVHPWRLLAAAALLIATILGAALAIGAFDRRPPLVDVVPTPTPIGSVRPGPTTVASIVPAGFAPPDPVCPAPATAPPIPDVTVSVGSAPGQTATQWGSGTTTCGTHGTNDGVASVPVALLSAEPGDRFTLVLPAGWRFLHVEPTDAATTSVAVSRPTIEASDRPSRIEVPVTAGPGESIVGFDLWIISDDGHAVVGMSVGIRVRVTRTASSAPPSGGTLDIAPGAIRTSATTDLVSAAADDGPRAVELILPAKARTGGSLTLHDLETGSTTTLTGLAPTHLLDQMALSGERLAWVESWRDKPSPPSQNVPDCPDLGKPLRWQILLMTISTGATTVVASGTNKRLDYLGACQDVGTPSIAIDGDSLAYTLESTTAGQPLSDRIVLRDLGTGSEVKSLTTDGAVEDLHVSGKVVVYRENPDTGADGLLTYGKGRLMEVGQLQTTADVITDQVGAIALGGGRLAWVSGDGAPGTVWTAAADGTGVTEVASPAHDGLTIHRVEHIAVTDGLVAWSIVADTPGGCCASLLAVWAPGEPTARFIEGYGTPDAIGIGSGWLVWHTNRYSLTWHDDGTTPDGFHAVSMEALVGPWR